MNENILAYLPLASGISRKWNLLQSFKISREYSRRALNAVQVSLRGRFFLKFAPARFSDFDESTDACIVNWRLHSANWSANRPQTSCRKWSNQTETTLATVSQRSFFHFSNFSSKFLSGDIVEIHSKSARSFKLNTTFRRTFVRI